MQKVLSLPKLVNTAPVNVQMVYHNTTPDLVYGTSPKSFTLNHRAFPGYPLDHVAQVEIKLVHYHTQISL